MNNPIVIAIDAMGGDNSPDKVIEGISLHSKSSKEVLYKIFGNKNNKTDLGVKERCEKAEQERKKEETDQKKEKKEERKKERRKEKQKKKEIS